jgi:hypothetical protein
MGDKSMSDTDTAPKGPQGSGESVTTKGNEVVHDPAHPAQSGSSDRRDHARDHAQQAEREKDRMQGSLDPQRPGPDPEE